jgi:phage terminase large subunit
MERTYKFLYMEDLAERTFRFQDTTATRRIFELNQRIRAVAGGTAASKTISILVWLIDYSQTNYNKICTVTSESYPHLQDGAMRDFQAIMKDRGYWDDDRWHDTKHTYTFETGSIIEFKSIDTYGKAHGPRRDVLFINECNNFEYKIADQLITRTREIVWLDWNPTNEFWFYTEMQPVRNDLDFITLTYKDNEALDQITISEIESHKHNTQWWRVYGLGQLGEVEGRIYKNWIVIDTIPHEAKLVRRGLDFGFSNDPAALIDVYKYNGGFILDERLYKIEMHNKPIADFINSLQDPQTLVIADSSEPKSIDELMLYGVNVLPANKGQGSINAGISYLQDQKVSMTKRSVHLIKEYRNYLWKIDKDGKQLRVPEEGNDHLLDAARYALEGYMRASNTNVGIVTVAPPNQKLDSFYVNENGEAEGFHVNIADAIKRNIDEEYIQ